jgi:crotonobetainyl-CoA:carnitine CoA-transferase CaiB-like acyl-CoA transferase
MLMASDHHDGLPADSDHIAGVLSGVKVVDLSRHMAAPYATVVLSDYGADVIKVESVPDGDPARRVGTGYVGDQSGVFLMWNRGKRSIALDLRSPEGLAVVHRLVAQADVFVASYRPGVAEKIGVGYEDLKAINPRLVYCAVSAFGPDGPLAAYPGTDPVIQAMSGVMAVTGDEDGGPVLVGAPMADFTTAMTVVQAVLLGLLARERTGRGQRIDVSMLASLVFSLTTRLATYWATGEEPGRHGSAHSVVAPYQAFQTSDGWVVAGAWASDGWPRFCDAVGRPELVDDERFVTNLDRVANRKELNAILEPLFLTLTTREWERRFHDCNALFGEICSVSQIVDHPQLSWMRATVDHSTLGEIPQMRSPVRLSETDAALHRPPPVLGQHTREVLVEAGYSEAEIDELCLAGIAKTFESGSAAHRTVAHDASAAV